MKEIRRILANVRRADETYDLINENDKIVLGISGGKDSLVLLYALHLYSKFSHKKFTLIPVILDLGFSGFDARELAAYCTSIGYELIVSDAKTVYPILEIQKEKQGFTHLPCSICSRMKKAAINRVANDLGANKVAFAHHADDAIETLVLNAVHGGRLATFAPKMHLSKANITFIRPLILVREQEIEKCVRELLLPVMPSPCPADQSTKREDIKQLLKKLYHDFPAAKTNFLTLLDNEEKRDLWGDKIEYQTRIPELVIKPVYSPEDKTSVIYIRMKVFVEEQKVPLGEELTADEFSAHYFLMFYKNQPIATIRYYGAGHDYHLGRYAVLKEYRGRGFGSILFQFVENYLSARIDPLTLSFGGQAYLDQYYQNLGYKRIGDEFLDAGIKHYRYEKMINKQK